MYGNMKFLDFLWVSFAFLGSKSADSKKMRIQSWLTTLRGLFIDFFPAKKDYKELRYPFKLYLVKKENLLLDFQLLIVDLQICALPLAQNGFLFNQLIHVKTERWHGRKIPKFEVQGKINTCINTWEAGTGSGTASSGKLDSDPHQVKGRLRICMKKKSRVPAFTD